MVTRKRNIRSLQDIHTLSGNVNMVAQPYRAYMKISCLEMEKARRGNERESAVHRVRIIDERFRQIEAEKAALLKALGTIERSDVPPGDETKRSRPAPAHNRGGFKISY